MRKIYNFLLIFLILFLITKNGSSFELLSDDTLKLVDAASGIDLKSKDNDLVMKFTVNQIYYKDLDGFSGYPYSGYLVLNGNMDVTLTIIKDTPEVPSVLSFDFATAGPEGYTPPFGQISIPPNVSFLNIGLPVVRFEASIGSDETNRAELSLVQNPDILPVLDTQKLGSILINNIDFTINTGSSFIIFAH